LATNEEIQEQNKLLKESVDLSQQQGDVLEKVRLVVKRTTVDFRDINTYLKTTILNSKELPKRFSTVEKLQKAITKDGKIYNTIQKQTKKDLESLAATLKSKGKTDEQIKKTVGNISEEMKYQLDRVAKQNESIRKQKAQWFDVDKSIDSIGKRLRDPAGTMDSFISSASAFPLQLWEDAKKEGISLGEALKDKVKSALDGVWQTSKVLFSPGGLLIVGITAAIGVVALLWKGMKSYWDYLSERVIPAQADFNKQLGASGRAADVLKQKSVALGNQFVEMGLGFAEGAQTVRDFAEGMRTANLSKESLTTGIKLISVLGLSGDAAAKLSQQFMKADGNLKGLDETLNISSKTAEKYGLNASQIMRDMADSPDILARFGTANRLRFKEATIIANQYGTSIKTINKSFGKVMDTFEGTSETASKLNAAFGTNIDSMQLMLETNDVKRFEMVRKSLEGQHKSWDKLNTFEKNVLTSTLSLDDAEAALLFTQGKGTKALEKYRAEKDKNAKSDSIWNRGIGVLKRNIVNLEEGFNRVMRSVGMFAMKLFNIPTEAGALMGWGTSLNKVLGKISDTIAGLNPEPIGDLGSILKGIPSFLEGVPAKIQSIASAAEKIANAVSTVSDFYDWATGGGTAERAAKEMEANRKAAEQQEIAIRAKKDNNFPGAVSSKIKTEQSAQLQNQIQKVKEQPKATSGSASSGFNFQGDKTIQINLMIDGKKIAEQLVKLGAT
jgi:hypothetical protein